MIEYYVTQRSQRVFIIKKSKKKFIDLIKDKITFQSNHGIPITLRI